MDNQQQIDAEIPMKYIEDSNVVYKDYPMEKLPLFDRFNKDMSKDFYLGMIAASRAILSAVKQISNPEEFEGFINCICIHSTMIASNK